MPAAPGGRFNVALERFSRALLQKPLGCPSGCDSAPWWTGWCCRRAQTPPVHGPLFGAPLSPPPLPAHLPTPPLSLRRSCSPKTPQRWRNRRPRAAPIVHPQLPGTGFSITPLLAQEVFWGKKGTVGVGSGGWAHLRGHRSGDGAKRPPAAAPTAGRGTRRANCCPDRATSPRVLLPSCTAPSIGRAWDCSETPRGADGEGRWEDEALFSELHK